MTRPTLQPVTPPNVFLVEPQHAAALNDPRQYPVSLRRGEGWCKVDTTAQDFVARLIYLFTPLAVAGVCLLPVVAVVPYVVLPPDMQANEAVLVQVVGLLAFPIVLWLCCLSVLIYRLLRWRSLRRMTQEGRIVYGTVRRSTVQSAATGVPAVLCVRATFTSPTSGATLRVARQSQRDAADLPPAGTPVAVLYLNDRTYALL